MVQGRHEEEIGSDQQAKEATHEKDVDVDALDHRRGEINEKDEGWRMGSRVGESQNWVSWIGF